MSGIQLHDVKKIYPNGFQALHGIDLSIQEGEFMVFVGPSGCAKSTLLRMIAGLESISAGEIMIQNRCVNQVLPKDREVAMVFQNYALYPHMTVYKNMAFSLSGKMPREEIDRRVREAAENLEISHLLERKPGQLSGGQCQRVALGRAIVRRPRVFLFDEPLSNLDAKLRVSMRLQLINLHQQLKAEGLPSTMIYVTHDQVEAMTMGDRICVLDRGVIQQVDKPVTLYHQPANKFVAAFIGSPAMNLHDVTISTNNGQPALSFDDAGKLVLPASVAARLNGYSEAQICLGIRPEHVLITTADAPGALPATVQTVEHMGNEEIVHCDVAGRHFVARFPSSPGWSSQPGERIGLQLALDHAHLFDITHGRVLRPAGL
ncbi:sn-glycerol-3-phosphate ABC transporter ATP-binding protein UgpC [Pantoea cypripedii]|uniref:ABC transporter ATP-binding protein n=1 Tax=Pantoea cypripedii TaxID=55209 RepID=UPI002FC89937